MSHKTKVFDGVIYGGDSDITIASGFEKSMSDICRTPDGHYYEFDLGRPEAPLDEREAFEEALRRIHSEHPQPLFEEWETAPTDSDEVFATACAMQCSETVARLWPSPPPISEETFEYACEHLDGITVAKLWPDRVDVHVTRGAVAKPTETGSVVAYECGCGDLQAFEANDSDVDRGYLLDVCGCSTKCLVELDLSKG